MAPILRTHVDTDNPQQKKGIKGIFGFIFIFAFVFSNCQQKSAESFDYFSYNSITSLKIDSTPERCPDIEIVLPSGEIQNLAKISSTTIALRFTRFHSQDIPSLRYLDSLYRRYNVEGYKQYFIYNLGKTGQKAEYDKYNFITPIIEDDGNIAELLNAKMNDFIIIDREYNIKIRNNELSNQAIYNFVKQSLGINSSKNSSNKLDENNRVIENIIYLNVYDNNIENLYDFSRELPTIIFMHIAPCMTCVNQQRIKMLKSMAESALANNKYRILFLFESNNQVDDVREWALKASLYPYITVGIIYNENDGPEKYELKLLKHDIDPYIFIIDKNMKLVFSEEQKDSLLINKSFLERYT